MRHRIKGKRLKRPTPHRLLMLRSLAIALIEHEKVKTTEARAKELIRYISKVISVAKDYDPQNTKDPKSINSARKVFSMLANKKATKKVLEEIAPRFKNINGGYTTHVRIGERKGDGSQLILVMLRNPQQEGVQAEAK